MKALISVSDKTGIVEFAQALHKMGVDLISTGGTAKLLSDHGLPVKEVSELTGFPEMLDGRVKTLHPGVHAGLLARRDLPAHLQSLADHDIACIDLLVVNLYPFEKTVSKPGCSFEDAIENIDIGGPAMVRSAAKNWQHVAVVTDSTQYAQVLQEIGNKQTLSDELRLSLSVAAFNRISNYDASISNYLSARLPSGELAQFPNQLNAHFTKIQDLRYGENPHQSAAFYKDIVPVKGSLVSALQVQGKELSYNNLADADTAWECVKSFKDIACVIVKHANPCGVATGHNSLEAYQRAFSTDPTSAFGGIIAFNSSLDATTAQAISEKFVEVLIATDFSEEALRVLAKKPNVRVLKIDFSYSQSSEHTLPDPALSQSFALSTSQMDVKRIGGGLLVQTADTHLLDSKDLKIVTKALPTPGQIQDMLFAWKVAKFVKSNAIVFCKNAMTLGVGAGQMSRLDSAKIASIKAEHAGLSLKGSVVASDAFFPFRDGLDVVVSAGATCIIQPGGSVKDPEVIEAANEHGVCMAFSSVRHFRH